MAWTVRPVGRSLTPDSTFAHHGNARTGLLIGEEIRKVDRPHFRPDTAGGPEIRDAAFGGNAGAGERNDDAGLVHEFAQAANGRRSIGRDHAGFPWLGATSRSLHKPRADFNLSVGPTLASVAGQVNSRCPDRSVGVTPRIRMSPPKAGSTMLIRVPVGSFESVISPAVRP
jgi:hypothetical protein